MTLQSEDLIKDYAKKIIDRYMPIFDSLFNTFIENKSSSLSYTLQNYQCNYYESYYIDKKSEYEIKNEVRGPLMKKHKIKLRLAFLKI